MTKKKINKFISLILSENVYGLGKTNNIVKVKPGYARYLLMKNKALFYNEINQALMLQIEKDRAEENAKKHEQRLKTIKNLQDTKEFFFYVVAGDSGKIFGRITRQKIKDKLQESGFDVPVEYIIITDHITSLGSYETIISFGSGMPSTDSKEDSLDENEGLTAKITLHIKDATQDPAVIAAKKNMR